MSEKLSEKNPLLNLKNNKYTQAHSELIRAEEWEKKHLPKRVKRHTINFPSNLAHSNLFMLPTRGKDWLLADFPITSKWMPSGLTITFTGEGLDAFDFQVYMAIIKSMETREKLNPIYLEEYADLMLQKDDYYTALPKPSQKEYRLRKIDEFNFVEGIFFENDEFLKIAGLAKGGNTAKKVKRSLKKLNTSVLNVETNFGDENDFETAEKMINLVHIPSKDGFFVTLTPLIMNLFTLQTSTINTFIIHNLNLKQNSRQKLNVCLYSSLMTFQREVVNQVSITEFLAKSPYYLMKQRMNGEIKNGKIAPVGTDGVPDPKDMDINQLNKYIANNRRDILNFFERLQNMGAIRYQTEGRGDDIVIRFNIPRTIETIAEKEIRTQLEVAKQLSLLDDN